MAEITPEQANDDNAAYHEWCNRNGLEYIELGDASAETETYDTAVSFRGSGYGNGTGFIVIEPFPDEPYGGLPFGCSRYESFGFDLRPGVKAQEGYDVLNWLSSNVTCMTYHGPKRPEYAHVKGRGERAVKAA